MAKIQRFEDLVAWQKARMLAGSVMHNIAEGFDSGYDPEFARFLRLARRSASEMQSQLYLALDAEYITKEELSSAYELAVEAKKLINGMLSYLNKSQ